jgi:hypothetical protein
MYRSTFSWPPALVGGYWPASRPGRFTPGTHWIGRWVDHSAGVDDVEERKFLPPPGLELRLLSRSARSQSLSRLPLSRCFSKWGRKLMAGLCTEVGNLWEQMLEINCFLVVTWRCSKYLHCIAWRRMERNNRGLIEVLSWHFPGEADGWEENSRFKLDGDPAETRKEHAHNTSLECYRYANLLGVKTVMYVYIYIYIYTYIHSAAAWIPL